MAKKILWKDNTMPPTNYLWLKLDSTGKSVGLYEHTSAGWNKIANDIFNYGSEIIYNDNNGKEHTITVIDVNPDGGVVLEDSDGTSTVTLTNKLVWSEYNE